jgi:hypothetical protein
VSAPPLQNASQELVTVTPPHAPQQLINVTPARAERFTIATPTAAQPTHDPTTAGNTATTTATANGGSTDPNTNDNTQNLLANTQNILVIVVAVLAVLAGVPRQAVASILLLATIALALGWGPTHRTQPEQTTNNRTTTNPFTQVEPLRPQTPALPLLHPNATSGRTPMQLQTMTPAATPRAQTEKPNPVTATPAISGLNARGVLKEEKAWLRYTAARNPMRALHTQWSDLSACIMQHENDRRNANTGTCPARRAYEQCTTGSAATVDQWTNDDYRFAFAQFWASLYAEYRIDNALKQRFAREDMAEVQYSASEMDLEQKELCGGAMQEFVSAWRLARAECTSVGAMRQSVHADCLQDTGAALERDDLRRRLPPNLDKWLTEEKELKDRATVAQILDALATLAIDRGRAPPKKQREDVCQVNELRRDFTDYKRKWGEPPKDSIRPGGTGRRRKQPMSPEELKRLAASCEGKECPFAKKPGGCYHYAKGKCFYTLGHPPKTEAGEKQDVALVSDSDGWSDFDDICCLTDDGTDDEEDAVLHVPKNAPPPPEQPTHPLAATLDDAVDGEFQLDGGAPFVIMRDSTVIHNFQPANRSCGTANDDGALPLEGTGQIVVSLPGISDAPEQIPVYYSSKVRRNLLSVHELDVRGIKDRSTEGYLWKRTPEQRCQVQKRGKKYFTQVKFHLPTDEVFLIDDHCFGSGAGAEPGADTDKKTHDEGQEDTPEQEEQGTNEQKSHKRPRTLAEHKALCHHGWHKGCEACAEANLAHTAATLPPTLEPPREAKGKKPDRFGKVLLMDGVEDREKSLIGSRRHMWVVKDRASGWREALFTGDKRGVGAKSLENFQTKAKATNEELDGVQTYGDGAYATHEIDAWTQARNGFNRATRSKASKEHAEIESGQREIQRRARATLLAASMPSVLWNIVAAWVILCGNFWGVDATTGKTPYEMRYRKTNKLPLPPQWGTPVWFLDDKKWATASARFASRASVGWFVGIDPQRKAWLVLQRPDQLEMVFDPAHQDEYALKRVHHFRIISAPAFPDVLNNDVADLTETNQTETGGNNRTDSPLVAYGRYLSSGKTAEPPEPAQDSDEEEDENLGDVNLICSEEMHKIKDASKENDEVRRLCDEEIEKHLRYDAMTPATEAQVAAAKRNKRFARASFYGKQKRSGANRIRLACQGFRMCALSAFGHLSTSMATWEYIAIALSFQQAQMGKQLNLNYDDPERWIITCFDVVSAFLQCKLGLAPGEEPVIYIDGYGHYVVRGGVNGIKEAPRAWQRHRNKIFKKHGLQQCLTEPAVFKLTRSDETTVIILTHVDDFIVIGQQGAIKELFTSMADDMEMTRAEPVCLDPKGPVDLLDVVGTDVIIDHKTGTLYLSMVPYLRKAAVRHGHAVTGSDGTLKYKPGWEPSASLTGVDMGEESVEREQPSTERLALQGTLGWAIGRVRWDLKFPLKIASSARRNDRAMQILQAIARALYVPRVLVYDGKSQIGAAFSSAMPAVHALYGASDADYATCKITRKSVGGIVLTYCGNVVLALCFSLGACDSSTQSEVASAHTLGRKRDYLAPLIRFLRPADPLDWLGATDSQPAFKAIHAPLPTGSSKHYGVKLACLREIYSREGTDGLEETNDCRSSQLMWVRRDAVVAQCADYFTHMVTQPQRERVTSALGFAKLQTT